MEPDRVLHFELVRRIGRGGMGEVYEATDLKLRRRVAIKFLSPDLATDPAALTRFEREAHSAAELNHPHIATVYAFEQDGDRPFIAMELLSGLSLRERIERGALPVAEALAIARDVAAALAYAHRRGTSHRDIKPENLMFGEHGEIKIMDFGLARATMASKLTDTGTSLGTPAYMAPEALRGETGHAGDVFALGLCLYEMIAGRRAYAGDNAMAVMFAISNEEPAPLRDIAPDTPEPVEALLRELLVKDPTQRIDAAHAARELGAMTGVSMPLVSAMDAAGAGDAATRPASPATSTSATTRVAPPATSSSATTRAMVPNAADIPASARTDVAIPVVVPRRSGTGWRIALVAAGLVAIVGVGVVLALGAAGAKRRDQALVIQRQGVEAEKAGNHSAARALYEQALKLDPNQPGALTSLGLIAEDEQRYATAESLFTAVLRHARRDPSVMSSAYLNRGTSRLNTQQYQGAIEDLRAAMVLDSSTAEIYNNLGLALIQNGQPADARPVLERGIARFPGVKFLFKNAALAAIQLGDPAHALTYVDRALRIDPKYAEAESLRAQAIAFAVPHGQ